MTDKDKIPAWAALAVSIGTLFVGLWVGEMCSNAIYTQSAIKAGVAEYQVNPKTGQTRFVWITNSLPSK